ncbi:hypothetical protein HNR25_005173 [Streptomonospora salina]|uniref:Uncharacterized protein n=1 Tax=Streptomonospora salina TaxID=104205 RepID=A0A841EDU0_9ACTN|nr:hypothetical protein [Streptomonospora salina]MBB6001342.1 hypothetical protein [Streptomonospora salina]
MSHVVVLLARAKAAGLTLRALDGRLRIAGPRRHGDLGQALLERKETVLEILPTYLGERPGLDWCHGGVGELAPCLLCGRPSLVRDPYEYVPMHKLCADPAIRWGVLPGQEEVSDTAA